MRFVIIDEILSLSIRLHRETGVREEFEIELPLKTFLLALLEVEAWKSGAEIPKHCKCLRYPVDQPLSFDYQDAKASILTCTVDLSREVIEKGFRFAAPSDWVVVRMKTKDRERLLEQWHYRFTPPGMPR